MTETPEGVEERMSRKERQRLRAQEREAEERNRRRKALLRRGVRWGVLGVIVALGAGWLGYSITTAKRLPSTSMADHIEQSPPGHILTTPMPIAIQKHMLEHADGGGRPGVVINYN